ncbi:hypothetical protein [Geobacter sp.]|uniref:hypothetical protein n=1 Tax=Geobacter sp. TaxID=46610 RepID=UPI002604A73F|nr:hypothetical protein [Geobacter sp.]
MRLRIPLIMLVLALAGTPAGGADKGESEARGTIFTLWPLVDYRESPREGFRNLSLLGPLIKVQARGDETVTAVRPLFYRDAREKPESAATDYLYPLASSESSPDVSTFQVLKLYQKNVFRRTDPAQAEKGTMLFPFYITGESKKYGPYTSVFPFYGDIYERFWRDEYHYVLFPLYGRTVKGGTTTRNYLYPVFSTVEGKGESGFAVWPLYGQSSKEGVYRKRFALWPIYDEAETGLDTDNPTRRFQILPLFVATDSPKRTSRHYLWPFFGWVDDRERKVTETYYLWPFVMTARGEGRTVDRYLPFYDEERGKETLKRWYLWPLFRHDEIAGATFGQERDRVLYFLFSDSREWWPTDGAERRRTALWPLFVYNRDVRGVKSFSFPAPLEPILDREGFERSWSPLWRIYVQKWNDAGDSAASFLWNLYWHERRGEDFACEFFPVVSYRSEKAATDLAFLKGLVRFEEHDGVKTLSFFWLPFGISWGESEKAKPVGENESGLNMNKARLEP